MAVLLVSFLVLMVLGCPIAFCLLCSGTFYFLTNDMALIMVVQRLTEGANTFTLLAVPGFILAGNLMNSGEVTDRIFDFCGKLVGHITGGLGHANILASVVFAGMSGAAIADAGGLGAIELKAMHDAGYDDDFSLAVTGASSLVGPIIPPSVPAVVYGTVASVSIGRLFMAGAVPGAIMAIAMCTMVYIISQKRGYGKEEWCGFSALFHSFKRAFLSLLTVVVILGGILAPIFAPLGFGKWQPVAASISGFSAKESIVSTMGVLANVAGDDAEDTMIVGAAIKAWFPSAVAAFSFLLFNLLDSPCLAAISTMAHEMQSRKWFWFAILFQNIFAYVVTLCVYQIGLVVTGAGSFGIGTIVALILVAIILFLLFRPDPYKNQNDVTKRSVQAAE